MLTEGDSDSWKANSPEIARQRRERPRPRRLQKSVKQVAGYKVPKARKKR